MHGRADTRGRIVELARIGLGMGDQLCDGVDRQVLAHAQEIGDRRHQPEQHEILLRIVGQPVVKELVGGEAGRHDQDLGAVGRSLGNSVDADVAAGPHVLDDRRHLPERAEPVGDDAADDVLRPPAGNGTTNLTVNPAGYAGWARATCHRRNCCRSQPRRERSPCRACQRHLPFPRTNFDVARRRRRSHNVSQAHRPSRGTLRPCLTASFASASARSAASLSETA